MCEQKCSYKYIKHMDNEFVPVVILPGFAMQDDK